MLTDEMGYQLDYFINMNFLIIDYLVIVNIFEREIHEHI